MTAILNESDLFTTSRLETYECTMKVKHLIIFDIFNNLPRLDENEKRARDNVNRDQLFSKHHLKDFYQFLKKKYTNFIQLAYVDDELLHEFYEYQLIYDAQKKNIMVEHEVITQLHENWRGPSGNPENMSEQFFKKTIEKRLSKLTKSEGKIHSGVWTKICLNRNFADRSNNKAFLNIIQYNPELSNEYVFLEISLVYKEIGKDINSIFDIRKDIYHLIVNFTKKELWNNSNSSIDYFDNENYFADINKVFSLILHKITNYKKLDSIFITTEEFPVELSENNACSIIDLITKNESLNLLFMKNIIIPDNKKLEFVQAVYKSKSLKIFHLGGLDFTNDELKDFNVRYKEINDICYISFNLENTLEII